MTKTTVEQITLDTTKAATQAMPESWENVRMSVKSSKRVDFSCDLSALVDMSLDTEKTWGKKGNITICNIPAQRLKVEGLNDVYVSLQLYTREDLYTKRQMEAEQAAKTAKLEQALAANTDLVAQLESLGFTRDEIIAKLSK